MMPLWMTTRRPLQSRCGVSVLFGGAAVCRPAGMTDPVGAAERFVTQCFFETAEFTRSPSHSDVPVDRDDGDAGGVVPPVFELA